MIAWVSLTGTILATVAAQLSFKSYFLTRRLMFMAAAAMLFCLAVIFTFLAVRTLGIGRVYVGSAMTYVLAPLAARRLFGEYLGPGQYLALGLIVAGVLVYNF